MRFSYKFVYFFNFCLFVWFFFLSLLAPLLHLTCGTGAVDDKDFAVSSYQGSA